MLSLIHPIWLWALAAAVLLPLAVHLLARRRARPTLFPAARFVRQAQARAARLHRPTDLFILLLRALTLAMVVLALAEPRWHRRASAQPAGDGGIALVLVVDRSASMERGRGGATLFDQARQAAAGLLQRLDPSRDVAAVVLLDEQPTSLLPTATANLAALESALWAVEPTRSRGDLTAAIALAWQQVRDGRPPRLIVLSDMQATQMAAMQEFDADVGSGLTWQAIGVAEPNIGLGLPRVEPARPVVGEPAKVLVRVGNFSDAPRRVPLALSWAGGVLRDAVELDPYASGDAALGLPPLPAGEHTIRVALDNVDDALPSDDAVALTLTVAPARRVALLTRADDDPANARFFVERALQPGDALVDLTVQSPDEPLPADAEVIVLAEAGSPTDAARQRLERFVARGGGALVVVDSSAATAWLDDWHEASVRVDAWSDQTRAVSHVDGTHPWLAVFTGAARVPLERARFGGAAEIDAGGAAVLIRGGDDRPLLVATDVGHGRLAVLGASLSPTRTELARSPAFAPLLHQIVRGLAPRIPDESLDLESIDPRESDLRTARASSDDASSSAPASASDGGVESVLDRPLKLWPWLIVAAAALLVAELALAQRGGRHA